MKAANNQTLLIRCLSNCEAPFSRLLIMQDTGNTKAYFSSLAHFILINFTTISLSENHSENSKLIK